MSDAPNTTTPVAAAAPVDTTPAAAPAVDGPAIAERVVAAPVVNGEATKTDAEKTTAETTTDATTSDAVVAKEEPVAEKVVEPITEGQLAYKGPGLVKSLIPSKKEFWLNDSAVASSNLDLYLRGEKPEVAHPIVAWASQTGKGLLFFNKKGETNRTHPHDILALYEATDLKKESPHSFSFKINGHSHSFKATSDAERDGWYISIEKSIELGKAAKEEIRASEAYTAEFEKLNKPAHAAPVLATKRNQSQPKKSGDVERTSSSEGEVVDGEKKTEKKKSRSTSRGILNRFQSHKKEEKVERDEEKKVETADETKPAETAEPVLASTEAAPVHAAVATSEIPSAGESKTVDETVPVTTEEKINKPNKRASIFGRVSSGWSSIKSPSKEKSEKDAELKVAEPNTTEAVSENPPVLPETGNTEAVPAPVAPAVEEPAVVENKTQATTVETAEPTKEKPSFLTTLMNRARSVSPSTAKKEPAHKKEETAVAPIEEAEPVKTTEEPVVAATEPTATPVVEPTSTSPVEKTEEPATKADKRQSVLGSLGRRASKALNRIQTPKKETSVAETKKEDEVVAPAVVAAPATTTETAVAPVEADKDAQKSIGDVVPEAVSAGEPQTTATTTTATPAPVTASA